MAFALNIIENLFCVSVVLPWQAEVSGGLFSASVFLPLRGSRQGTNKVQEGVLLFYPGILVMYFSICFIWSTICGVVGLKLLAFLKYSLATLNSLLFIIMEHNCR